MSTYIWCDRCGTLFIAKWIRKGRFGGTGCGEGIIFGCRKIASAKGIIETGKTGRMLYIIIESGGEFSRAEAIVVGVTVAKLIFLVAERIISNILKCDECEPLITIDHVQCGLGSRRIPVLQ